MKSHFFYACSILAAFSVALSAPDARALGAARGADTVLIIPARPAIMQLAFDLENMRAVTLVSFRILNAPASPGFVTQALPKAPPRREHPAKASGVILPAQTKANAPELLIHVWNGTDWQYVSLDDFGSMAFIAKTPQRAIVIGDDQAVPRALLQNMNWPCKIERLPTLKAAEVLNGLDPYFEFSSREWKRLAKAYGLQLEDVNAAKRSFNPYAIPRSKTPLATHEFKQEKDDTPPAVLIEQPDSQPVKRDSQPAEKPWIK